jgi:transposase
MDIGSSQHQVAIGLSNGDLLEEFTVSHTPTDIEQFFNKIEDYHDRFQCPIALAMEAYNGYARPIDRMALQKGYRVLNVNNHKLAQFKKIFPGAAKTDAIDTKKMFELFTLSDHLPLAKGVLQPILVLPEANEKLKRLTRRRQLLVEEKVRIVNRLQGDLQAISPGLASITGSVDNRWFLHFLVAREAIEKLATLRLNSLLKIKGIGKCYAAAIVAWQETATFSTETTWVGAMVICDAKRILELLDEIKALENAMKELTPDSEIASRLKTILGFGEVTSATLAGELGTVARFTSEASLALYLGMAILDNSSGNYQGTKQSQHVNKRAKTAMITAVARHIDHSSQAKMYYDKKRSEGKKHNQAVRALGRHLVRVIWSMLTKHRDYQVRD